jgi:hypothetical protein
LTLASGAALAIRFQSGTKRVIRYLGIGVLILAAAYFVGCLRLGYFKEWRFNADSKQVYRVVDGLRRRCGVSGIVTEWRYAGPLNFYRRSYGNYSIPEFAGAGVSLPTDKNIYVVYYPNNEEFIKQQRLEVVYHNEETNAAVAIRACEQR